MARENPPPFESSKLPAAVAGLSSPCDLADGIENHLAAGGEASVDLLVAHAWAVFETALEVMVDEVVFASHSNTEGAEVSRSTSARARHAAPRAS